MGVVVERWLAHWRSLGDREAFSSEDEETSFAKLAGEVVSVASRLREMGITPGDVVMVTSDYSAKWASVLFALADCGAIVVPANAALGEYSKEERCQRVGSNWTLRWEENGRLSAKAFSDETTSNKQYSKLRSRGHAGIVLFSGGSTGGAKGVVHDLDLFLDAFRFRNGQGKRILSLMVSDHVAGIDVLVRSLASGVAVVETRQGGCGQTRATLSFGSPTAIAGTPSQLGLISLEVEEGADQHGEFASIKAIYHGAESMPEPLRARLSRVFPNATLRMRFGTTETGALSIRNNQEDPYRFQEAGDDGSVRIDDGELWLKQPESFVGYLHPGEELGKPEADGWFRTGDLVEVDEEGWIRLIGRRANTINVGGEKVRPELVESVIETHPSVICCRAFGEAHALLGEVVALEVVWTGEAIAPIALKQEIVGFVGDKLAPAERPVKVCRVDTIGMTAVGKMDRRRVAE